MGTRTRGACWLIELALIAGTAGCTDPAIDGAPSSGTATSTAASTTPVPGSQTPSPTPTSSPTATATRTTLTGPPASSSTSAPGTSTTRPPSTATTRPATRPATTPAPTTPAPTSTAPTAPTNTLPAALSGRILTTLPTSSRVVALTFDCGASDAGVASILGTLADEGIHATFFASGDFAARYPQQIRRIAQAGHRVGNHSTSHPDFTTLSAAQRTAQVRDAEAALRPLTGRTTRPWFRFPYGASNAASLAGVNALGYAAIGWTVDTLGWKGTSGGQSADSVVSRVSSTARPGQIVLMHVGANPEDGSTLDADALPQMVRALRMSGYTFVTLDAVVD